MLRRRQTESKPERVSSQLQNREKDQKRRDEGTMPQRQSRKDAVKSHSTAV